MPRPRSKLLQSIQNRTTVSSARRAAAKAGVQGGIVPSKGTVKSLDFSKGDARKQGIGEVVGEIGQTHRLKRAGQLAAGFQNRTTGSSRKRLYNRILANLGQTAGFTGTTVTPKRRRLPPYAR